MNEGTSLVISATLVGTTDLYKFVEDGYFVEIFIHA